MLKFGNEELQWDKIASISNSNGNVIATDIHNTDHVIGNWDDATHVLVIQNLIEAGKVASSIGGTTIVIIIDDL